jgi:hypothetical protein
MDKITKLKVSVIMPLTLTCLVGVLSPAWSEIILESLDTPIQMIITDSLNVDNTNSNTKFSLVLPDILRYENLFLPQNTEFKGEVVETKKTTRFNRYGYFKLQIQEICTTDSNCINLSNVLEKPLYIKFYQDEIQKKKNNSKLVSKICKSALSIATGHLIPGASIIIDSSTEIYKEFKNDPMKEKPFFDKLGEGVWEGTGVPRTIKFFKIGSDPAYKSGQIIEIRFKEEVLKKLMESFNNTQL